MNFEELGLDGSIKEGLDVMGFEEATPIQEQAIPLILKGRDLIACAQTGTGKTAAFVLPILHKLSTREDRSLVNTVIIAPTRELVTQIDQQIEGFSYFTDVSSYPIYGGGTGPEFEQQKQSLKRGADIVICTPGRLIQHLRSDYFDTSAVEHFILDEADRMMDMGFYDDIMDIASKLPEKRQNLFFSATMPPKIRDLCNEVLHDPASINIAISKPAEGIQQKAYMAHDDQKVGLVTHILQEKKEDLSHVLIFASSIKSVKEIKSALRRVGLPVQDMHSELEQSQREEVMRQFKHGKIKILVATDILSRGIDIKGIDLVINYEVPHDAEDYVHRIGRTARADATGEAITFINGKQVRNFMDIEKLIERSVDKLPLPDGFGPGPVYKAFPKKKKRKWHPKGKKKKHGGQKRKH